MPIYKKELCFSFLRKIIKIPEKQGDQKYMLVGMLKKVYKEMVKEMNIIASKKDSYQEQCASQVCNH